MGGLSLDPNMDDPQAAAEDYSVVDPSGYGDPGMMWGSAVDDPSAWIPDTSQAESALSRLRGLSESYLGGADMGHAFDEIKQSKLNALRAARAAYATPQDQSNLPQLAFAAAMLAPTRSGKFSEALSSGLSALIPEIKDQRVMEQARRAGLAGLESQAEAVPGDIMSSRLTAGTDLLSKAQELEFKIQDLKQRGLWNQLSAATRLRAAQTMANARIRAANINQQGSNQRRMQATVQQAQTLAKQDAQNLIAMHYNLPADQYDKWLDDRTAHIMQQWGYKPEDYQGLLIGSGGGTASPTAAAPAGTGATTTPAEQELQQELQQEATQRGQATGAAPAPNVTAAPQPGAAAVPSVAAPGAPTPDVTAAQAENALGAGNGWSRQAAVLTPGEQKDVDDADQQTNNIMMAQNGLQKAIDLNSKAYGGALAGAHTYVQRNLRWIPGYHMSDKAINTTNYENLVNTQVVQNLRASFGGNNITEGERKYLEKLQGSINLSPEERLPILQRAQTYIDARRRYYEWKSRAIRSGTYRNMSYADFLKATNDPLYMSVIGKSAP